MQVKGKGKKAMKSAKFASKAEVLNFVKNISAASI